MKQEFNGYDITNVVLYDDSILKLSVNETVRASANTLKLQEECENFLKYIKAKYN